MKDLWLYFAYALPLLAVWAWHLSRRRRAHAQSAAVHADAVDAGLTEPVSLHPIIDPNRCLGCGACVAACPEQPSHQVLGLIGGKAQLISPTDCIGHGACKTACPTDAITLVFGTEKRGVTIPTLTPKFESTVPGIYVAGELGGMGLIRNALTQGRQAIEAIHERRSTTKAPYDVVVIGAGPAGFAAALTATALKMRYVVLEQDSLGGCVFQYPRGKLVMTSPAELPLVGKLRFTNTSKEILLKFWQDTEAKYRLNVHYNEYAAGIERTAQGVLRVTTKKNHYDTNNVLLAIGRRGTPRKLAVPGEDAPKVVYRLIDPEQYRGKRVLVVGGGDSALEAAASLAETDSVTVALSYRGDAFGRAKQKNRARVDAAMRNGRLKVLLKSQIREVKDSHVILEVDGKLARLANDIVIVNAGGVLPNDFLKSIGIAVETKYGTV